MNDILAKKHIQWVTTKRSHANGGRVGGWLVVSQTCAKHKSKPQPQAVITLSAELMKELRWVIGDRINIGMDDDGYCYIARHPQGAFAISATGAAKEAKGKTVRGTIKITAREQITPVPYTVIDQAETCTDDGMLMFEYPRSE